MPTELQKKKTKPKSTLTPSQKVIKRACDLAVATATEGIGTERFTCSACGQLLDRKDFYMSSDPVIKTGVTCICKKCAYELVHSKNEKGEYTNPTKESICDALSRLDKPYLETVYQASVKESEDYAAKMGKQFDIWATYIKNISMPQYRLLRWKDSDFKTVDEKREDQQALIERNREILDSVEQNRKDTIKLLGYDPFAMEKDSEKPFLYAQLISYLDASEDANQDAMRISSITEIVKSFSHIEKLNEHLASLYADKTKIERQAGVIKSIEDIKTKITANIQKLAEESCISMKNSKNNTKGENTWTGKVRKLKDMNLREQEVNLFDANTAQGIAQVAEISDASIIKQIALDENDSHEMLIEQRDLIKKYKEIAERNEETSRILLRENSDLKATLKEHDLLNEEGD